MKQFDVDAKTTGTSLLSRRDLLIRSAVIGASAGFGNLLWTSSAAAASQQSIDAVLTAAVQNQDVPFVVAMAGNANGITYTGMAGERAPGRVATLDTLFRIFSMTKAVGSTAAMILVDRGKLDFDTPVEDIIPEFGQIQVLDGFDGNTPILRAPKVKATVRHLATHTSGLVYDIWNEKMQKYVAITQHPSVLTGLKQYLFSPMMFDPGDRWDYGIGIDWLGQIVEKIDGRRIDRFCQDEIFDPLSMTDTMFEIRDHAASRLCQVSARGEDGKFAPFTIGPPSAPEVYGMGHALYSTAPDYMQFLRMFLNNGELDGNRILSESAVESMLQNHIGDLRIGKMETVAPVVSADVNIFPDTPKTHSFGFLRVEEDVPGMRSAGSQGWAGVCNTHFWFDPAKDVAGLIMTQTLPFVEPRFMKVYEQFERAVYAS